MDDDDVTVMIHHGGKFVLVGDKELEYVGGKVTKLWPVDIDTVTDLEMVGYAKTMGYRNVERVYYLIPGLSLYEGLRSCKGDLQSLDMMEAARVEKHLEVYLEHSVDMAEDVELPTLCLPSPVGMSPVKIRVKRQAKRKLGKSVILKSPFSKKKQSQEVDNVVEASPNVGDNNTYPSSDVAEEDREGNEVEASQVIDHSQPQMGNEEPQQNPVADKGKGIVDHLDPEVNWVWEDVVAGDNESNEDSDGDSDWERDNLDKQKSQFPQPRMKFPIKRKIDFSQDINGGVEGDVLVEDVVDGDEAHSDGGDDDNESDEDSDQDEELVDTSDEEYHEGLRRKAEYKKERATKLKAAKEKVVNETTVDEEDVSEPSDVDANQTTQEAGEPSHANEEAGTSNIGRNAMDGFQSEYEDSEEEMESSGDSEDDLPRLLRKKKQRIKPHTTRTVWKGFKWQVNMSFPSGEAFKDALAAYAIANGYSCKIAVSDKRRKRIGVVCKPECSFYLYVSHSESHGCWLVRSVKGEHQCSRSMLKNPQMKYKWVAKKYLPLFKEKPNWPARDLIRSVKRNENIVMPRWTAYKAKEYAKTLLHGSMFDHYNKLGKYIEELKRSNPGGCYLLTTTSEEEGKTVFHRFFVSFDGLSKGLLEGCRKVLFIDGTFLKTFLGGVLLAAIGVDGNNQMFPLAWAVVESENNDSWEWFLIQVSKIIGSVDGSGWSLISDEHKSILKGVAAVFPRCEHRHCARHIYSNWKKLHKGDELKMVFWKAAKAYNEADLNEALEEMKHISPQAWQDFNAKNPRLFCRAFLQPDRKCDTIVSNMAETFNAYIVKARHKPLIDMLEDIRTALMERMVFKKGMMANSVDEICPRVRKNLEKEKDDAGKCTVHVSGNYMFQVHDDKDIVEVNLQNATCTCRKWDLTGVPCFHAIASAAFLNEDPEKYVNIMFKRQVYLKAYEHTISPCVGERHWPSSDLLLLPPPVIPRSGRPKTNRRKDPYEDPKRPGKLTRHGRVMKCSICRNPKHNSARCPFKQPNDSSNTGPNNVGVPGSTSEPAGRTVGGRGSVRGRGAGGRGSGRESGRGRGSGGGEAASRTVGGRGRAVGREAGRGRGSGRDAGRGRGSGGCGEAAGSAVGGTGRAAGREAGRGRSAGGGRGRVAGAGRGRAAGRGRGRGMGVWFPTGSGSGTARDEARAYRTAAYWLGETNSRAGASTSGVTFQSSQASNSNS